ncbi:MAG: hypothetical protein ACTSO3_08230 [Candidatus Heimdallarchaeaceae archaeon]
MKVIEAPTKLCTSNLGSTCICFLSDGKGVKLVQSSLPALNSAKSAEMSGITRTFTGFDTKILFSSVNDTYTHPVWTGC